MTHLFDTDAVSEVLKKRPAPAYLEWLATVPRDLQFSSAVTVGELYKGAYRSAARPRHLTNIRERVLPALTVLPYDADVAHVFGKVGAQLEETGQRLADADLQIAATALFHGLELVTGNLRHFGCVEGLRINPVLAEARAERDGESE